MNEALIKVVRFAGVIVWSLVAMCLVWLILLWPNLANAAPQNWKISWADNQPAGTTVHASCGLDAAAKVEVGTAPSTALSLNFALGDVGSGSIVSCALFPTNGAAVGPTSVEVSGTIPLALPALVPILELVP